jgi:acyl-CoA thioester hydrolase
MSAREPSLEVWRGAVNTWNCDEMGHMNVRFYVAHALQGLGGVAAAFGMPEAFSLRATSTLEVRAHRIRFLREARAGSPLHLEAGVLAMDESEALVLQVLKHSLSGEPCAAFVTRIGHVTTAGRAFPWPRQARDAATAFACDRPPYAQARGVPEPPAEFQASLARAETLGLLSAARGVVLPEECDVFGRLRTDAVMGRFSDGAAQLFGGPDRGHVATGARIGGAMLEISIVHHRQALLGSHLWLRSGLCAIEPKLNHVVHWLLDPMSGEPVATAQGVAAALDLDARKIAVRTPEQLQRLQSKVFEGLTP